MARVAEGYDWVTKARPPHQLQRCRFEERRLGSQLMGNTTSATRGWGCSHRWSEAWRLMTSEHQQGLAPPSPSRRKHPTGYAMERNARAAAALASRISPERSTVSANHVKWVAPPHFYIIGKLIVLYVGTNTAVLDLVNTQSPQGDELVAGLHRNSAYLCRRAALASRSVTSGATDNCPVAIQSCRMTSARKAIFLAPIKSAWRV
jgi:hypothetical protein